jgi:hypothetical protein
MNVRLPLLAATLVLPLLVGGCAPPGMIELPPGVCNSRGAAVIYGFPNSAGEFDATRYSDANCKK